MIEDSDLRQAIESELRERQREEASDVSASVHRGVVQLTGRTGTYCEKYFIERAIRAIAGVSDVVNEIEVRISPLSPPPDSELRCEVLRALHTEVPAIFDRLTVNVHDGEVTLGGTVQYHFLKERAESAVRRLGHIATVHNTITLDPQALAREVQEHIDQYLRHSVDTVRPSGCRISACASDGKVTLSGAVSSEEIRALAERAAWSVEGVKSVTNGISVLQS
jgi:osmotically-inducible protein OsmY